MQTLSFSVQRLTQLHEECDSLSIELGTACLIQIFSSQQPEIVDDYYASLQHFFPNSEVIGLSVIHSSIDASIFTDSTVISISILDSSQLTSASVFHSQDETRVGHHLLRRLSIGQTTKAIIAFGCYGSASNYKLFDAFSEHQNQIPVSGGVAADTGKGTWVFLNGRFYYDQIVAVAMHGEQLQAWSEAFVEWNPIGKRFRITSSEGNIVKTIDHLLAYDFYCKYLADNKLTALSQIQAFPLMLKEDTVRYINGVEAITEEGYLQFASPAHRLLFAY
jgi:hypothetical protein